MEDARSNLGLGPNRIRQGQVGSSGLRGKGQDVGSSQADLGTAVVRRLHRTASVDLAGIQRPVELRGHAGMVRRSPTSPPREGSFIPAMYTEVIVTSIGTPDMYWPAIQDKSEINRRITRFLHFNRQWRPIGPERPRQVQVHLNLDDI